LYLSTIIDFWRQRTRTKAMSKNHEPELLESKAYETRDMDWKLIFKGTLYFFIFCFASAGVVLGWIFVFDKDRLTKEHMADNVQRKLPEAPAPLLQTNITAKTEIAELRKKENAILNSDGINSKTGARHIPIDSAMDLLIQKGVPTKVSPAGQEAFN